MSDYLSKPVDPQALERCLMRWLRPARQEPAVLPALAAEDQQRLRLEALSDLDTRPPLARMRGAWPLYLRTLRMFIDHHRGDVDRLASAAWAEDAPGLRALAHSLAGASATVGAVAVMQQAQALQRTLDAGTVPTADAGQPLAAALQRCMQQVQAALDVAPAAGATRTALPTPAALRAVLQQLQPLVAAHDTAALALFERHRPALMSALGADAVTLAQHLDHFNFGAAQVAVARALQTQDAAPG